FYNMHSGDAPVLKQLADKYTLNDNYHQPVMGGTAVQHVMIMAADALPWDKFVDPSTGTVFPIPPGGIANPNPKSATNVAVISNKAWTNCSDPTQRGIAPIVCYLASLRCKLAPACAADRLYLITHPSPGDLPTV